MLLDGKVVMVTGASRGIGRATAIACASHGADVSINAFEDEAECEATLLEIRARGRRAIWVEGDVADPKTARTFLEDTVAAFGEVDGLVNNAGICPFHTFLDLPADVFRRTLEVNYTGAFQMTQAVAGRMVAQGRGGAIVSVSSISALVGGEMQSHYTPTKAAIHSLMQSCAISLGRHGIRCNSVLPGTILTDLNKPDLADDDKRKYMEGRIPLGRLGHPGEVADCVVFLLSSMARYVNGAALLADGGLFVNLQ